MTWAQKVWLRLQVTALIGVIGCPIFIATMLPDFLQQRAAENWPTAEGQLTELSTEAVTIDPKTQRFLAKPIYHYSVNGADYTGTKVHLDGGIQYSSFQAAIASMADYQVGQTVNVYYDPAAPAVSALKVGVQSHHSFLIIALSIATVVCLIFSVFTVRSWMTAKAGPV